ncbi:MAG: S-layer homology domain-containing protein, partial [Firmicutes bacterium]|nr:S-layer homology domain-containing protein [Bacillota bacterium]
GGKLVIGDAGYVKLVNAWAGADPNVFVVFADTEIGAKLGLGDKDYSWNGSKWMTVVSIGNNGYPYGKDMNKSSVTLVIEAENASSYQWQRAQSKDGQYTDIGEATSSTYTFTEPVSGTWYRCVVDGENSKAVRIVKANTSESGDVDRRIWTEYSYSPSDYYYISNGTMAYRVNGEYFDVTGLYTTKAGVNYMLQTSYSTKWTMYGSIKESPGEISYSSDSIKAPKALRVAFSDEDRQAVLFEAQLADGDKSFAFGCDTQLGNSATSGSYYDKAALIGTIDKGVLKQIAMIGAASEIDATEEDPAFVIAPDSSTYADRFWIGYYYYRKAFAYNMEDTIFTETEKIDNDDVVTRIEGDDSGMTMSWLNVENGGPVKFVFKVGNVGNTGAVDVSGAVDNSSAGDFSGTTAEGLDKIAEELGKLGENQDKDIEVKLIVDEKAEDEMSDSEETAAAEIKEIAKVGDVEKTVDFVDLTLTQKIGDGAVTDIGDSNVQLLKIELPFDKTNKHNISVYRFHDENNDNAVGAGEITEIPQGETNAIDGEYCVVGDSKITLYVKKFSLYGIGYLEYEEYTVNFDLNYVGGVDPSPLTTGVGGKLSGLPDADRDGYTFKGWYTVAEGGEEVTTDTVFNADATVYAQWQENSAGEPPVSKKHKCESVCGICGGCLDEDCGKAACVDKCTAFSIDFDDVTAIDWYSGAVNYVCHRGIMEGIGDGLFDPAGTTTRAMIVTTLWRLEGEPAFGQGKSGTFADVEEDVWYTEAVEWAAANEIVEGYGDGNFGPMDSITREQLAAILYRYAQYKGYDVSVGEDTNILSFEDAFSISEYAFPALQWVCGEGIMEGKGEGMLEPISPALRGEIAQILMNFLE